MRTDLMMESVSRSRLQTSFQPSDPTATISALPNIVIPHDSRRVSLIFPSTSQLSRVQPGTGSFFPSRTRENDSHQRPVRGTAQYQEQSVAEQDGFLTIRGVGFTERRHNSGQYAAAPQLSQSNSEQASQWKSKEGAIMDVVLCRNSLFSPFHQTAEVQRRLFNMLSASDFALVRNVQILKFQLRPRTKHDDKNEVLSPLARAYLKRLPTIHRGDMLRHIVVRCKLCCHYASLANDGGLLSEYAPLCFSNDRESFSWALHYIKQHLASQCQCATAELKKVIRSMHLGSVSLSEVAYWYAEAHKLFPSALPSSLPGRGSITRWVEDVQASKTTKQESFWDLDEAVATSFSGNFNAQLVPHTEMIRSTLSDLPWSECETESNFVSSLLDCLEVVRTRCSNGWDANVRMQCRYCHGRTDDKATGTWNFHMPFLPVGPLTDGDSKRAAAWMHVMGYSHADMCDSTPLVIKNRLKRIRPETTHERFALNGRHLQRRYNDWLEWGEEVIFKRRKLAEEENIIRTRDIDIGTPLTLSRIRKLGDSYEEPNSLCTEDELGKLSETCKLPPLGVDQADVVLNVGKSVHHEGNVKFSQMVESLQAKVISKQSSLLQEYARTLVRKLGERGVSIGVVNECASFERLPEMSAIEVTMEALQNGFSRILHEANIRQQHRGPGSLVVSCEKAPLYGLLHDQIILPLSKKHRIQHEWHPVDDCQLRKPPSREPRIISIGPGSGVVDIEIPKPKR